MVHSYFPAGKHRTGDENPMWNHRMERRMTRDKWRVPLRAVVTVQPVCLVHAFCTGSTDDVCLQGLSGRTHGTRLCAASMTLAGTRLCAEYDFSRRGPCV